MVIVTKPKPLHFDVVKSRMTLTLCTAPKGPKSCQRTLSSVSGAKLYTKMHQPVELRAVVEELLLAAVAAVAAVVRVVGRIVFGSSPASSGEYLNLLEAVA